VSDAAFPIAWTSAARRVLTRLPEKAAAAVAEVTYGPLAANPHRVGKPLRDEFDGLHSARRGDFRIIYRIADDVTIIAIEHRDDVYRRR
jgi:mRNA-degrading endonuclease RelE of RelBE toxin-antitoxin system